MKFGMTGVLVEYFANQTKNTLVVGANADKITSIYALVDFAMDAWKPFLKVESSEYRKNDDGSNALSFKRTAYNVGVEMMPKANDAFRYHLAIASTADKYGTAGTKDSVTWMQVMLGLKYSTDLLK